MLSEHDRRKLLPFSDLSKKEIVAFFFASTLRDIFFLRAYLLVRFITAFVHQNLPQILGTVLSKKITTTIFPKAVTKLRSCADGPLAQWQAPRRGRQPAGARTPAPHVAGIFPVFLQVEPHALWTTMG